MPRSPYPPHILQNSLRVLAAATAVLYLALAGLTLWSRHSSVQNRQALCAFKSDLQSRVASGTKFLEDHPNGVPGINRNVILASLHNERATIHALRFLPC